MLDVHPPHQSVHSWRDFFVHIATIVVGLLIALGLEQTVERIHEHREVSETRASLRADREKNRQYYSINVAELELSIEATKNNFVVLSYLKAHPGTAEAKLPGVLSLGLSHEPPVAAAWNTALQNRVTSLMPPPETQDDSNFYRLLTSEDDATIEVLDAITRARAYAALDPDLSHLSPQQIDAEIERVQDVAVAEYRWGLWLSTLHGAYRDFGPPPSEIEMGSLIGSIRASGDKQDLSAPAALTADRLAAAKRSRSAAIQAAGGDK